jgi:hypothetical protein
MRFSAWISVALSVLWMIGGTGYFWLKDGQEGLQFATDLYFRRSSCLSENAMLRYQKKPEFPCVSGETVTAAFGNTTPNLAYGLLISSVVLVAAWIVLGLTYQVVRSTFRRLGR